MSEVNVTEIKTLNGYPLADTKARADIATLSEEIEKITGGSSGTVEDLDIEFSTGYLYDVSDSAIGLKISTRKYENENSVYTPELIDLGADAVGSKFQIIASNYSDNSSRCTGFCEADGTIVSYVKEKSGFAQVEGIQGFRDM